MKYASRDACPVDTVCAPWERTAKQCVMKQATEDTPVVVGSVVGDCKKKVCKVGAPVVLPDDTDAPSDADPCIDKLCASGEMTTSTAADGTPCRTMGAIACKGGLCEGCNMDAMLCSP